LFVKKDNYFTIFLMIKAISMVNESVLNGVRKYLSALQEQGISVTLEEA
jgi:hypothetical protein